MKQGLLIPVLILLAISANTLAQDTNFAKRGNRFAAQIIYSPVLFFPSSGSNQDIDIGYNFQAGLGLSIYKYKRKHRFGGTLGLLISTKSFSKNYNVSFGSSLLFAKHKYTYLKIPILFNYSFSIKQDFLIGLEAGVQLSYFIDKDYYSLYNDGSKKDKFPSELDFSPSIDLAVNLCI